MAASDVFENFLEPSPREDPKRPIEEFELRERLGGDIALDFDVRTVREQQIGHPAQNLAQGANPTPSAFAMSAAPAVGKTRCGEINLLAVRDTSSGTLLGSPGGCTGGARQLLDKAAQLNTRTMRRAQLNTRTWRPAQLNAYGTSRPARLNA